MASELMALAERCEREKPSLALEAAIYKAVRGEEIKLLSQLPKYTVSIDAAATLVPPNTFGWNVESKSGGTKANAMVARKYFGQAETEALALCAAALRAQAAPAETER